MRSEEVTTQTIVGQGERDELQSPPMPVYCFVILLAGWVAWMTPFIISKRNKTAPQTVDRRARVGIVLVAIGYAILWMGPYWRHRPEYWRVSLSVLCYVFASLLSWGGRKALGRQWRVEAGLNADHELVTSGPYRFVRHPIYASMLGTFLATGFMITPLWRMAVAAVFFIVGTEIRVRVEDHLLTSHFGDSFRTYQRNVPAYIPFLR
jgi:protein-S-isoprenylcysteine O-methyltransferase Ste14